MNVCGGALFAKAKIHVINVNQVLYSIQEFCLVKLSLLGISTIDVLVNLKKTYY